MKILITVSLMLFLFTACSNVENQTPPVSDGIDQPLNIETDEVHTPMHEQGSQTGGGGASDRHRIGFYQLKMSPSWLVDSSVEFEGWLLSRTLEEQLNESVALAFVRHFNISREDFEQANEESRQRRIELGGGDWSYSEEAIDLIFSFDNEGLSRYFIEDDERFSRGDGIAPLAWMFNGEVPIFGSIQMGRNRAANFNWYRDRFYTLPDVFIELVDRDEYFEWFDSRSFEERLSENIASAFVQRFNISREDFEMANEEWRVYHGEEWPMLPEFHSWLEAYPVNLIFSFDHEAINEFFLWENSPSPFERMYRVEEPPLAISFSIIDDDLQLGDDENQDEPSGDDIPGDEPDFDSRFEYEDEVLDDLYLELEDMPELDG